MSQRARLLPAALARVRSRSGKLAVVARSMRAQRRTFFRLALERREAKRSRLQRRDGRGAGRVGGRRGAALLPHQHGLRIAVERRAREFARGLQALEGAGAAGQTRDVQQRLRLACRPAAGSCRRLCAPCAANSARSTRAVRQRLPVRRRWGERQEQQGARIARQNRGGNARADLAHRHEELVEGQASRHSVKPQGYRDLIPCLTVKNQTPKIALGQTQWQSAQRRCNVPAILSGHVGVCIL